MSVRDYKVFAEGELRITYTLSGTGPPLLLVHGLAGSRRWWRRNLAELEARYSVYRIELVGFGYARGQRPMPLRKAAEFIVRWMDHAQIERAHVLGHSMGGHIAMHVASLAPERVDHLVLASSSGLLRGAWWRMLLRLPQAALTGHPGFVPVVVADGLRAGVPTLFRATRELLSDDVTEELPRITAPTLLVWGCRDPLVPPSLAREMERKLPDAELVLIQRAGHVPMWDAPEEFNEAVVKFLDGRPEISPAGQERTAGA